MKKLFKQLLIGLFVLGLPMAIQISTSAQTEKFSQEEPFVTATFFDSDLRESLKEVSLQTGVAFVCDDHVNGIITMDLKNVPLEKALRMMISGGGFVFRKIDDYYVIGLPDPKNPVFQILCESEIYYFRNISIESARALLPDGYRNYIRLDSDKGAAMINAPSSILKEIRADLIKMDIPKAQIRIKALVTEVESESLKELGMDVLHLDFNASEAGARMLDMDIAKGIISGEGDASFGHFTAKIKALVKDKKATIHSDPVLLVTEGKIGELFVGEKRTLILYSQGTSATSSSTQNVEAGTVLKVTPRLFGDQIELTISQKISNFYDETSEEITVKSREFSSVIRFLPGQTIMVAGLTEKKTRKNTSKTPLLGDIPLVGLLFKQKSDLKGDSEFLIFLTAEVLKDV